jgi:hypothetical protein
MTSTSAVPDVIGYLVDLFTADATLGAASPPVTIRCGPQLSGDFPQLALFVAVDDPTAMLRGDNITGAVSNQVWVGPGARKRDEQLSVHCTAEAWSGEVNARAAMLSVYGILSAVEVLLHTNVYLGGASQVVELPGSTGHTLRWLQGEGGLAAHIQFRIDVKARIGS